MKAKKHVLLFNYMYDNVLGVQQFNSKAQFLKILIMYLNHYLIEVSIEQLIHYCQLSGKQIVKY